MLLKIVLTCLVGSVLTQTDPVDYHGYRMIAIPKENVKRDQISERFYSLNAIDAGSTTKEIHFMVPPRTSDDTIMELFHDHRVIHEDMGIIFKNERSKKSRTFHNFRGRTHDLTWDDYYDIDTFEQYLKDTSEKYPNITMLIEGGKSYEGRTILGLRINTSNKPAAVIESGIHAREWITPAVTTYLIETLLTSDDPNIRQMRDSADWHIFPSINPDGYHYSFTTDRMWRKTRSPNSNSPCVGTDPNRNWDYNWGSISQYSLWDDTCSEVYPGSKPFSEIETRTFSQYVSAIKDLRMYIGVHADAQMLLIPYSDSTAPQDNYKDLVSIGKVSLEYGKKVNDETYDGPDTSANILYSCSGVSMDWVKKTLRTGLTFIYEMRGQDFNWPKERIPEQGKEFVQMIRGLLDKSKELGYWK